MPKRLYRITFTSNDTNIDTTAKHEIQMGKKEEVIYCSFNMNLVRAFDSLRDAEKFAFKIQTKGKYNGIKFPKGMLVRLHSIDAGAECIEVKGKVPSTKEVDQNLKSTWDKIVDRINEKDDHRVLPTFKSVTTSMIGYMFNGFKMDLMHRIMENRLDPTDPSIHENDDLKDIKTMTVITSDNKTEDCIHLSTIGGNGCMFYSPFKIVDGKPVSELSEHVHYGEHKDHTFEETRTETWPIVNGKIDMDFNDHAVKVMLGFMKLGDPIAERFKK